MSRARENNHFAWIQQRPFIIIIIIIIIIVMSLLHEYHQYLCPDGALPIAFGK